MSDEKPNNLDNSELLKALTDSQHFRGADALTQRIVNRASAVTDNSATNSTSNTNTPTSGTTPNESGS